MLIKLLRQLKFSLSRFISSFPGFHKASKKISLILIRSNHPRRIKYFKKLLLKYIYIDYDKSNLTDEDFYSFKGKLKIQDDKTLVIYIGDSLTEYLSRVRSYSASGYRNTLAFWLGPITRLGFIRQIDYERVIEEILTTIAEISFFDRKFTKKILVWSSGTVDIRSLFYELLASGVFDSSESLLEMYENNSRHLIEKLLIALSSKIEGANLVLLSELNSTLIGELPATSSEIKKIRKANPYPTFGTVEDRRCWTKMVNDISLRLSGEYGIKYIDINKYINYEDPIQEQFDGVHLSNPLSILKINNEILNLFRPD